ncbi:MAG: YicC/YloC family endoribonuclease [Candidatus Fermentibacteraceae bacterium]
MGENNKYRSKAPFHLEMNMESMTGFGSASQRLKGFLITATARSVNHRGLSIHLRFPREAVPLEQAAHEKTREMFQRGRVELTVSVETEDGSGTAPEIDLDRAGAYVRAAACIEAAFQTVSGVTAHGVLSLPGVLRMPDPARFGDFSGVLTGVIGDALAGLKESRLREGAGLAVVFNESLGALMEQVEPIASTHGERVRTVFEKNRGRIRELLGEVELDEARFVQEVAVMADRLDVSEECQRLLHHAREALGILGEPVCGMKLGFLVQEMHRELNTMGAKVTDPQAVYGVIRMKELVGGMKEQAANVQ